MADEEIIPDELDSMDPHDLYESINKLAEEKGFLENIFNTISEGVMVIDNNLKIKYRNPAATRLLGIPDDTSRLSVASFLKGVGSSDRGQRTLRTSRTGSALSGTADHPFLPGPS